MFEQAINKYILYSKTSYFISPVFWSSFLKRCCLPGLFLGIMLSMPSSVQAQSSLTWEELSQVVFVDEYQSQTGTVYPRAEFSKKVRQREGQDVYIIGYLLPLDVKGNAYALSASPFAACFFCGKSGPETVMELVFKKKESWFAMDRLVMVRGVLDLNASDPSHLYYILNQAEVLERLDK
ncbi:MAG: DUF3299 domain-containing protein [Bacteroidetes bacterium]|nr:DUF3299 domain-containing protein [Bacteroidota bacterium]